MKTSLTYGCLMAIAGALFTLLMFFAGFHDSSEKMNSAQWIGFGGGIVIATTCLWFAMREQRAKIVADHDWGYGSALASGVLTGLFGALFGAIFAYLYFALIYPGLLDVILQLQTEKMADAGVPPAQIERMEPILRQWMSPTLLTIPHAFSGFTISVLLSMILAFFMRHRVTSGDPRSPSVA